MSHSSNFVFVQSPKVLKTSMSVSPCSLILDSFDNQEVCNFIFEGGKPFVCFKSLVVDCPGSL